MEWKKTVEEFWELRHGGFLVKVEERWPGSWTAWAGCLGVGVSCTLNGWKSCRTADEAKEHAVELVRRIAGWLHEESIRSSSTIKALDSMEENGLVVCQEALDLLRLGVG